MESCHQLWSLIHFETSTLQQCAIVLEDFFQRSHDIRNCASFPKDTKENQYLGNLLMDLDSWRKRNHLILEKNILWNVGSWVAFSKVEYFELYEQFRMISSKLNISEFPQLMNIPNVEIKLRETLVQAACTLRWVNRQIIHEKEETASQISTLLSYLHTIPKTFQSKFESSEDISPHSHIEAIDSTLPQLQHTKLGLIPLQEINFLTIEYSLIHDLFLNFFLTKKSEISSALSSTITSFLTNLLKTGVRSPLDLLSYQDLLWKYSHQQHSNLNFLPNQAQNSEQQIIPISSVLLHLEEVQLFWHWRLWKNPSMNLPQFYFRDANQNNSSPIRPFQGPSFLYQHSQTTSAFILM